MLYEVRQAIFTLDDGALRRAARYFIFVMSFSHHHDNTHGHHGRISWRAAIAEPDYAKLLPLISQKGAYRTLVKH